MISMQAVSARAGMKGFDCNTPVSATDAQRFLSAGFSFAMRYIPRLIQATHDLSRGELETVIASGLQVGVVQHVEIAGWMPTRDKAMHYGDTAAEYCTALGLPHGVTVWLDLEGVSRAAEPKGVIDYGNRWFDRVAGAGFEPGVYVGYGARLSAGDLYRRLRFTKYWGAYNLDADIVPAVCGVCMQQREVGAKWGAAPSTIRYPIDLDFVTGDHLGRLPTFATRVLAAA